MDPTRQTPHAEQLEHSLKECVQLLSERLDARMEAQEELLKLILAQTKAFGVESHSAIGLGDKERMRPPDIDSGMSNKNLIRSQSRVSQESSLSLDGLERKRRQDALHVSEEARSGSIVASRETGMQHRIQHRMQRIIGSTTFGVCICAAIFANTFLVGLEVELSGRQCCQEDTTAASIFSSIQLGFTVLFFTETLMRILARGCRGYFLHNPDWKWDFFDLSIVLTSVAEVVINSTSNSDVTDVLLLRVIRIGKIASRASRIVRLLKVARFFKPIRVLVRSLYYTCKSLIWIILSLVMIMYVFALVLTSTTNDYLDFDSNASVRSVEQLKQKFGTIPRSMFSLYSTVSGGVDWEPLVFLLAEIHAFWGTVFVCFQFFIYFAVMNVITGLCCEGAIESAYKDERLTVEAHLADLEFHVARFTEIFKDIDSDGNGTLTIGELEDHLDKPQMKACFESMDIDAHDAWTLFSLLDTDRTNDVDAQEFVRGCLRLKGSAKGVDVVKLSFEARWTANKIYNLSQEFSKFQNELAQINRLLVDAFPTKPPKSFRLDL